jgi:hypothetical protein
LLVLIMVFAWVWQSITAYESVHLHSSTKSDRTVGNKLWLLEWCQQTRANEPKLPTPRRLATWHRTTLGHRVPD